MELTHPDGSEHATGATVNVYVPVDPETCSCD